MNEYRIQALEGAIAERDRQISELRENFKKLKVDLQYSLQLIFYVLLLEYVLSLECVFFQVDFQYNLQLIQDRDAELQRYDAAFANLKAQILKSVLSSGLIQKSYFDTDFSELLPQNALRDRDREVSDLKVSIDEVEAQVRAEQQRSSQVEVCVSLSLSRPLSLSLSLSLSLYVCVCVCVCTYVCMYVCIHLMYACVCVVWVYVYRVTARTN